MDIEFNTLSDLYKRLEPALNTKEADLKRSDYEFITKRDIWDYLEVNKWKSAENLQLHQMVDDILHVDNEKLVKYTIKKNDR